MTGTLRSSDILDVINRIEGAVPVADWQVGDLRVWPLVRVHFYTVAMLSDLQGGDVRGSIGQRLLRLADRALGTVVRAASASLRDRRGNALPRAGTGAVFLSDGVSVADLDGRWYDRVCDPVVERLAREGTASFVLAPMSACRVPRRHPSLFVQPAVDLVKLLAVASARVPGMRPAAVELPGIERIAALLAGTGLAAAFPDRRWIGTQARRVQATAGLFGWFLDRCGARLAFVNTYYSAEGMAFVLAARRRGVVVADLQHGLQGRAHVAYGRWSAVPADGYELLPDEFWVWGEAERAAIDAWRPATSARHRPVVVGNLWLRKWQVAQEPAIAAERARVMARRAAVVPQRHLLVTVCWGIAPEHDERLFAALAALPPDWFVWVRLHPVLARDRTRHRGLLQTHLPGRHDLDFATDVALPALLAAVDLNVTHSSTTAIEAAEFGVRTVVTSEYGKDLLADQVADGSATHVPDFASVVPAIVRLATEPRLRVRQEVA